MSIRIELQCINLNDPSTDDCYTFNNKAVFESANDSQVDLIRAYKVVQATSSGWSHSSWLPAHRIDQ